MTTNTPKNTKPVASRTQNTGAAKSGDGQFTVDPNKNQLDPNVNLTAPKPRARGEVAGYSFKNLRQLSGEETPEFEATLYKDGTAVMTVKNSGRGGPNSYYPVVPRGWEKLSHDEQIANMKQITGPFHEAKKSLEEAALQIWPEGGYEIEDQFIYFMLNLNEIDKLATTKYKHIPDARHQLVEQEVQQRAETFEKYGYSEFEGRELEVLRDPSILDS